MKKKFLTLIVLFAVVLGIMALGTSLGWFQSGGGDTFKSQLIENGDMEYTLVGGCDIRPAFTGEDLIDYAAPGENMIYVQNTENEWVPGVLTINNKSTIATNLHVKIEYSWWNGTALETVVYGDKTDDFTVDFPLGWVYNTATKFWDYSPGGSSVIAPVDLDISANPEGINILINSMGYSYLLDETSPYVSEEVTVKLKVEAKQADYVEWLSVSTLTP